MIDSHPAPFTCGPMTEGFAVYRTKKEGGKWRYVESRPTLASAVYLAQNLVHNGAASARVMKEVAYVCAEEFHARARRHSEWPILAGTVEAMFR